MWLKRPAALHVYDLSMWTKPETDQNSPEFTQVTTCERGKFQPIASFFEISKKTQQTSQ